MFEPSSRYYPLATTSYKKADGQEITYVRRRMLPPAALLSTLVEVTVTDGDRLDLIAARTLGDAQQFWRICDAQNAMNPPDLTAAPGRVLRVPIPEVHR
jgi:hypothetical protein